MIREDHDRKMTSTFKLFEAAFTQETEDRPPDIKSRVNLVRGLQLRPRRGAIEGIEDILAQCPARMINHQRGVAHNRTNLLGDRLGGFVCRKDRKSTRLTPVTTQSRM